MTLVTVLMPVYNGERYLREAIESILCQTYPYFEFLIVNDNSTDSSEAIIRSYADDRIRYLKNDANLGITKTLNNTIPKCQGKLIARMDCDDIAHRERIEKQVAFFKKNLDVAMLGCWYVVRNTYTHKDSIVKRRTDDDEIRFHMLFRNQFLHPGIMIRTNVLKKMYYQDVSTCEDYDLFVRIMHKYKVANLPEILMLYRWHGNNISLVNQPQLRRSMIDIISRLLTKYEVDHTPDELLLQVMVALALPKEHFIQSGKIQPLRSWFDKLCTSRSMIRRFGKEQLQSGIAEYHKIYEFS